jgi:hypothetical protein
MTTSGTAHYAFQHSGTGERRRLDLLEDRLDPSRYEGPARSPYLLLLAAWRSAAAGDRSRAGCANASAPTGMSPRPTCKPSSCPSCRWRISACFAITCEPASSRQAPLTSFMCASSLCISQTGWPRSGGWSPGCARRLAAGGRTRLRHVAGGLRPRLGRPSWCLARGLSRRIAIARKGAAAPDPPPGPGRYRRRRRARRRTAGHCASGVLPAEHGRHRRDGDLNWRHDCCRGGQDHGPAQRTRLPWGAALRSSAPGGNGPAAVA